MIRKYTTEARAAPNNEIWEWERDGQLYVCERPAYTLKKLEIELLSKGFENESTLLFGKVLPFFFEDNGRWWAHPALGSKELLKLFTKDPTAYINAIVHKTQSVKRVMQVLRDAEKSLDAEGSEALLRNFRKLADAYVQFYSYHFITYIVSDEIVLRCRKVLESFLLRKEMNEYFTNFLQAEITKEAIKHGAIGETAWLKRDLFYSNMKPVLFYREPKVFFDFPQDGEVIAKLFDARLPSETVQEFLALRLITPISVQISEEGQYIESKMLCPLMKITLEKIKTLLVKNTLIDDGTDIRDFSQRQIERMLEAAGARKRGNVAVKGLGVGTGIVHGRVKIIKSPEDHASFTEGDILVTRITDPTMTVLMGKAAGIICDIGSMASHPSILSREMGSPCIVQAACVQTRKPATEILKDGMRVRMCGTSGEVHHLEQLD